MYDDELHEKASAYASNRKDAYLEKMRKKEVEQQTNTQLNWLWVAHYEGYKEGYWTAKDESMLYTTPPPPKEPEQEPVAWMIWGKNNVPSLTFKNPSDKHVFDSLYTTPPQRKEPEQEPVSWMSEDEREAFERFNETCEDGEGYDVPKTMMRRLAEIGVIHHTSRGIYGITKFGRLLVGNTTPPQRKPLTDEQIEEIAEGYLVDYRIPAGCAWNFARDIEAAHNIKE